MGGGSSQKVLKQEEDEIYGGSFVTNRRQFAESVGNFPAEHACFKPNGSPEVFNGNDDSDECLSDGERTTSSSTETERSEAHLSPNISPHKLETYSVNKMDQNGPPSSKLNTSMAYVDCLTSPGNLNQLKPNGTYHSIQHGSTSSSGWSADGTNESSFSEPSTPSSGFWEGTLTTSRPKIDTLDDSIQSSSNGDGNGYMNNSRSCRSFSFNSDSHPSPPTDVRNTDATRFASDGAPSTTLGIKKPIDGATLSKEVRGDAPKGRNSPLLVPEKLNRLDVDTRSDPPVSKFRDPRDTTFMSTHLPNVSSGSLSLERSNHVINGMKTTLHPLESKEGGFLSPTASVAHIPPSSTRRSLQGAVAASSSEVGSFSPNARNGLTTSMWKVVDHLRASKSSREHQSVVGSESVGRYNAKVWKESCYAICANNLLVWDLIPGWMSSFLQGLFPYDHFVKLYNWNKIELRPCGLTNTGNR